MSINNHFTVILRRIFYHNYHLSLFHLISGKKIASMASTVSYGVILWIFPVSYKNFFWRGWEFLGIFELGSQ